MISLTQYFVNVQRIVLSGLGVRNPETFAIRVWRLRDFRIEDISFDFTALRSSQDGVHLNGYCERGVIRNIRALSPYATNDDMIALNADDATGTLPRVRVMCQGVELGPIRDILVEHIRAESAYTFVRLLSSENSIENVVISDVVGGARACAINMNRWLFPVGGGNIRNVVLRDFAVNKMPSATLEQIPLIHIHSAVQNLRIENFRRDAVTQPPAPTLVIDNAFENRLRLQGLDVDQQQALCSASPEISPDKFATVPTKGTGTGASTKVLASTSKAKVTLPSGGFSLLEGDW